jgi:hypothetical protein
MMALQQLGRLLERKTHQFSQIQSTYGVKKIPGPLLYAGALDFMPISRSRVIRENHTRQTIIKVPVEIMIK